MIRDVHRGIHSSHTFTLMPLNTTHMCSSMENKQKFTLLSAPDECKFYKYVMDALITAKD